MSTQVVSVTNRLATSIVVHTTSTSGHSDLTLAPGAPVTMTAGPPGGGLPIDCIGIHGSFRGSPYGTCVAKNATLAIVVNPDGVAVSGTHH